MKNTKAAMKIHECQVGLLHTMKLLWIAPASKDEVWHIKPQMTALSPTKMGPKFLCVFDTVMMEISELNTDFNRTDV